ncbi:MAG: hypothetical protein ABIQ12_06765 [Opitutaceae bacterium]
MFGAKAVYLRGQLTLCFCAGKEPWRGVLVCTDQSRHGALVGEFPQLKPHPVLPKWLYLPETSDKFEAVGAKLVAYVRRGDVRIGVNPKPKQRRKPPGKRTTSSNRPR